MSVFVTINSSRKEKKYIFFYQYFSYKNLQLFSIKSIFLKVVVLFGAVYRIQKKPGFDSHLTELIYTLRWCLTILFWLQKFIFLSPITGMIRFEYRKSRISLGWLIFTTWQTAYHSIYMMVIYDLWYPTRS